VADSKIMLAEEKARLRSEVLARRDALADREGRTVRIHAQLVVSPEWVTAGFISTYVGVKSEVGTIPLITSALEAGKKVAVPVVEGTGLTLYRIESPDDLAPAPFGLLEPRRELRRKARRLVASMMKLFVVPGVAFDRECGRLGYGKGYYDGLLGRIKPHIPTIGLAFDAQLIPEVPMSPTDVRLGAVLTESARYTRQNS
jgi:5-formyltetrahydrofolate cyclo-ligase